MVKVRQRGAIGTGESPIAGRERAVDVEVPRRSSAADLAEIGSPAPVSPNIDDALDDAERVRSLWGFFIPIVREALRRWRARGGLPSGVRSRSKIRSTVVAGACRYERVKDADGHSYVDLKLVLECDNDYPDRHRSVALDRVIPVGVEQVRRNGKLDTFKPTPIPRTTRKGPPARTGDPRDRTIKFRIKSRTIPLDRPILELQIWVIDTEGRGRRVTAQFRLVKKNRPRPKAPPAPMADDLSAGSD